MLDNMKCFWNYSAGKESSLLLPKDYDASFPTVIGGGSAWGEKDYLAVRVEVTPQQMIVSYEDWNGKREEALQIHPNQVE